MESDLAIENRLSTARDNALNTHLILEKILYFVVHDDEDKKLAISEVCSVRQVSKSWLLATTNVLLASSQKAIFRIRVTDHNSSNESPLVEERGRILDTLLGSVTLAVKQSCAPLYAITASPCFFRGNHSQQLLNCLSACGHHLVELNLQFELSKVMKPLNPSKTSLSNLRLFRVSIEHPPYRYTNTSIDLIQSVFDASEKLVSFTLNWQPQPIVHPSKNLVDLVFPNSITDMSLLCPLDDFHLEVLVKNVLPSLRTLELEGVLGQTSGTHLFKILENYRKTLESFYLLGFEFQLEMPFEPPLTLELPLMEKLKVLKLETDEVLLATDNSAMHRLLPALQHLTLVRQTPTMLRRWTGYSRFDFVTSLTISFETSEEQVASGIVNVDVIPVAFPSLVRLTLTVQATNALIEVEAIWRQLKRLRALTIHINKYASADDQHVWDALFTGYSADLLMSSRESPDAWNELEEQEPATDSIRNLTDLEKLELQCYSETCQISLITDATFRLAFLKMPKLSSLILVDGVFASEEMTETWRGESRSIEHYRHAVWDNDDLE